MDDFDYTVFASTDMMKCFGCGKSGNLFRSCPESVTHQSEQNKSAKVKNGQNENGEVATTSNDLNSSYQKRVVIS